ncbi:MAG: hypothetical protein WD176_05275 [Pirellulales bacterium]
MSEREPLAVHEYRAGEVDAALEFLKRTRNELRILRRVQLWLDRFQVFDVNRDYFEIRGIGYADPDIVAILDADNTVYKPETIHDPTGNPYKEYFTGRRYNWAQDRVM